MLNELSSFLNTLTWNHFMAPEAIYQEAEVLIKSLQGETFVFSKSPKGKEILGFHFGNGPKLSLWYGFPNALSALGGLTCLTLMHAIEQFPELFKHFRFCVVPCLDYDGAERNQELFSGIEEMYSFAQSYFWDPTEKLSSFLPPIRPETESVWQYCLQQKPAFVFPLLEECLVPFPKLAYFVFGKNPEKKQTHHIRSHLKEGEQALHQHLHPQLGKGGFLLEERPEYQNSLLQKIAKQGPQVFWTRLGSVYSEEISNRKMSPYTEIEMALEEKHLAYKIDKNLLRFFAPPLQETPFAPIIRYYQNWCREKGLLEFTEEESLILGKDIPHLTLGEWRAFQGDLAEHVTRMGAGIRHLEAIHQPTEEYEADFLELMEEYKKRVPFGRISPQKLVKTQISCILEVLNGDENFISP